MTPIKLLSALALMAAAYAAPVLNTAHAAVVVDQSQMTQGAAVPFEFPWSQTNYPLGQSFTAGLNGILSNILLVANGEIYGGSNTFSLEIRNGDGVGGTLLGSKSITVTSTIYTPGKGWVFNLNTESLGITVATGHQYTFDFTKVSGAGSLTIGGIASSEANPYAGGRAYFGKGGYGNQPDWDLSFETSVITNGSTPPVAAIPEPETYAMLLAGLGLMGFVARRRKQSSGF
jgi:hypothetical protein